MAHVRLGENRESHGGRCNRSFERVSDCFEQPPLSGRGLLRVKLLKYWIGSFFIVPM